MGKICHFRRPFLVHFLDEQKMNKETLGEQKMNKATLGDQKRNKGLGQSPNKRIFTSRIPRTARRIPDSGFRPPVACNRFPHAGTKETITSS
jgi:hypothetical protein